MGRFFFVISATFLNVTPIFTANCRHFWSVERFFRHESVVITDWAQ